MFGNFMEIGFSALYSIIFLYLIIKRDLFLEARIYKRRTLNCQQEKQKMEECENFKSLKLRNNFEDIPLIKCYFLHKLKINRCGKFSSVRKAKFLLTLWDTAAILYTKGSGGIIGPCDCRSLETLRCVLNCMWLNCFVG